MPKTSIRKIARTLGLAPATVFRALSGSSNVAVNTRRKVIACANKLGYMLPEHSCCNIAVVVPHFNFRGYLSHMLPRLEEILHSRGYRVHLIPEKDIAVLNDHMFDGVISMVWREGEVLQLPKENPIPVVALNSAFSVPENISLVASDKGGFRMALDYLKSHGCRKIFFVGADVEKNPIENERLQEFKKFCLENGEDFETMHSSVRSAEVPGVLPEILRSGADGVFCGSETYAFTLGLAMLEKGIRIPEDISLLGMEIEELNTVFSPPITALSQDFKALAQAAVDMLIGEIEGKTPGTEIRVPMNLIERESIRKN